MGLPSQVILEDHDLESRVGRMSEKLAKLRWHWTLDESNTDRVKFKEYARAVGRADTTIRQYAHGYAIASERNIPLTEAMGRAKVGSESEAATEAVATARGIEFGTARQTRTTEVKRVRQLAQDRAEKHGTTVEEEAPKVAAAIVRTEKVGKEVTAHRKERLGLRVIELEGKAEKVKRELMAMIRLAQDIELGAEETDLLKRTLANLRALLHLLDMAIAGSADIDWDSELAKLTEPV